VLTCKGNRQERDKLLCLWAAQKKGSASSGFGKIILGLCFVCEPFKQNQTSEATLVSFRSFGRIHVKAVNAGSCTNRRNKRTSSNYRHVGILGGHCWVSILSVRLSSTLGSCLISAQTESHLKYTDFRHKTPTPSRK